MIGTDTATSWAITYYLVCIFSILLIALVRTTQKPAVKSDNQEQRHEINNEITLKTADIRYRFKKLFIKLRSFVEQKEKGCPIYGQLLLLTTSN